MTAIQRAVPDNACGAISISYGFCGESSAFYTGTLDPIFAQAAAQGQSVFVSSGDQGAAGIVLNIAQTQCVVGKTRNASEMSADPNVTAVGGTEFTPAFDGSNNDLGSVAESVWNDSPGASGGGKSGLLREAELAGFAHARRHPARRSRYCARVESEFAGFLLGRRP